MQIFRGIEALQDFIKKEKCQGKSIGLIPTMGALHAGHLSLVTKATEANDVNICSIYVNPIQFNNPIDLQKYPRSWEQDTAMLEAYPNLHIFLPDDSLMYAHPPRIKIDFGELETSMEGKHRPGHFNGVAIVVAKLFHMVRPDRVYFGQKDLQQCAIVSQLIRDLSFNLEMYICPTVREEDGLALSSRNRRLSPEERQQARLIPQALHRAGEMLSQEHQAPDLVKKAMVAMFQDSSLSLEYFEIVNRADLKAIQDRQEAEEIALCIAAHVGEIRLLDNIILQNYGSTFVSPLNTRK